MKIHFCAFGLAVVALVSLPGCTSMFSGNAETVCPGGEGVACTSMRSAYSMSNHQSNFEQTAEQKANGKVVSDAPVAAISVSLPQPVAQPMPVMEQAKIGRVWVNNWQDAGGHLYYPSLVYTEMTPRKWATGNRNALPQAKIVTAYRIEAAQENGAAMVSSVGATLPKGSTPTAAPQQQPASVTGQQQSVPLQLPIKN